MKSNKDVKTQIDRLVGTAAYASFRIFGVMPVRPGDEWYGLTAARQDGDDLVLSFTTQSREPWEFDVRVSRPQGLHITENTLTIDHAARVTFARSLDVEHTGKNPEDTTIRGGATGGRAAAAVAPAAPLAPPWPAPPVPAAPAAPGAPARPFVAWSNWL